MNCRLGNKLLKISCIQTLPGTEFDVVVKLKEECDRLKVEKRAFLKGFGAFDIILVYEPPEGDFLFHLSAAGPIKNILQSNLFMCFNYELSIGVNLIEALNNSTYAEFSLLKLNPQIDPHKIKTNELGVLKKLSRSSAGKDSFIVGTLGWNEYILITTNQNIGNLIKDTFWAGSQRGTPFFIKTLSFLSINYDHLPHDIASLSCQELIKSLDNHQLFTKNIPSNINITTSIASNPIYTKEISAYWKNKGYSIYDIVGKEDIVVSPLKTPSWSRILANLLDFRTQFKDKILLTHTRIIRRNRSSALPPKSPPPTPSRHYFPYEYSTLKNIFGEHSAATLARHFNSLNGLAQNPINLTAFEDLLKYPNFVLEAGAKRKAINKTEDFAIKTSESLRYGAELRLYGTYGRIEEVAGQFSSLRGGGQRALLALAALPTCIMRSKGVSWPGFIVSGAYKFSTHNSIIQVPTDALWNPQSWWALYHETAHLLIDFDPKLVNQDLKEIKLFLAHKEPRYWLKQVTELAAEVIGYELGFYGDFDLFMKLVWQYLVNNLPVGHSQGYDKLSSYEPYIIRTFFVYLFEEIHRKRHMSSSVYYDDERLYELLLEHITKIEDITKLEFKEKQFIASKSTIIFKELQPFAKHLHHRCNVWQIKNKSKSEVENSNTRSVIHSLSNGHVWYDHIKYPEAVLYTILRKDNLKLEERIATILTFANYKKLVTGTINVDN